MHSLMHSPRMKVSVYAITRHHSPVVYLTNVSYVDSVLRVLQICACLFWIMTPVYCSECQILSIHGKITADCMNKNLRAIPTDLDREIHVLKFTDNQLTYLRKDEFKSYPALQEIILVRNRIELIDPDAFRSLLNLQMVDLGENKLKAITPKMFQHLTSVRILSLRSNQLEILTKDAFTELRKIEELNFENCWIYRIHPETFKGLNFLAEINLVNNELKTLDPQMQQNLPRTLELFRLYRNPWVCDCNIRWLRSFLSDNNIGWDFITNVPTCDGPDLLHGLTWTSLDPDKFSCAAQIMATSNTSTSIELEVHGNVTIDCIVRGDPHPSITWMKGNKYVHRVKIAEKPCIGEDGQKQTCSSLTLKDLSLSDEGDYRCIARNNGGRSETTYKLWVHDPMGVTGKTLIGLTSETLIGIGLGAVVLVLLVAACIVWMVKKQDRNHGKHQHSYKAHNYKKQAQNGHENHSPSKKDPPSYHEDEEVESVIVGVKEKDKTTQVVINSELIAINHKPAETITEPKPTPENHVSPTKTKDFKMKIFKHEHQETDNDCTDSNMTVIEATHSTEKTPLCNHKPLATSPHKNEALIVDMGVPDVVQRPDTYRVVANQRSNVPPNGQIANHVQLYPPHKRAEENPYAKPCDMKPATPKLQTSKDKKNNGSLAITKDPKNSETVNGGSKRQKESPSPTKGNTETAEKKKVTTFAVDNSPCKNPVCLKDHKGPDPRSRSPTKNLKESVQTEQLHPGKHIKSSQSMGGLDMPDTRENSISPTDNKIDHLIVSQDRYKTLPNRPKVYSPIDDSRVYGTYLKQDERTPPTTKFNLSPQSAGSGGTHIELPHPVKTATIASAPRPLPSILRNPIKHEPQIHGFQPSLPPDPIPSHIRSKTLTPRSSRSSTGSHGDRPTSSPSRKSPKAFESTSLDDLLSPPFGHIQVERPKSPKTQAHKLPKPGEKDEYGTAV